MFDATGRVALVTGAGQGVGVGITAALGAAGAKVAVNDLDPDRAEAAAATLRADGIEAVAAPFDVTDAEAVAASVAEVERDLGPVDVLVNNAGVPVGMAVAPFRDLDPAEWSRYVDLNLYGSLHTIRAVLDGMAERRWGRIVQISSAAGRSGLSMGVSLYGASKSAVEGFIRHLAAEVGRQGITANALALGLMAVPVPEDGSVTDRMARQIPVGRLGRPDDVGAAVVYLASREAEWLTGQTIDLSGGATFH